MPGYRRVLVLLDLSDDSERVFIAGRDLAAYSSASIIALHVVEIVPVEPMGESLMPTLQIEEELVKRSRERHGLAILVNYTEDAILHAAHCDVLAVRLN